MKRKGTRSYKEERKETVSCEYRGAVVERSCPLESLECEAFVDAKRFFEEYVSKRKPVVLRQCLPDVNFKAHEWNLDYLKRKAGDVEVRAEIRSCSGRRQFGEGKFCHVELKDFLDRLASGDESLYMTTQDAGEDNTGRPALLGPPLNALQEDFPLRPQLLRTLVPSSLNVWMGSSSSGSSSGLHQDHHDNLYILIQGEKSFRLFSPENASSMQTYGKVVKIHPNGRINYSGRLTRADGAPLDAEEQLEKQKRRKKVEEEIDAAEAALSAGHDGAEERMALAEQELERILDEAMAEEEFSCPEEDGDETQSPPNMEPENFCKTHWEAIDLPSFHCDLYPGDTLYLPAGWFHEVLSQNNKCTSVVKAANYHMAFNYWFHPPDTTDFSRPYHSTYWEKEWTDRWEKKSRSSSPSIPTSSA